MGWLGIKATFKNVQEYAADELKIDSKQGILLDRAFYGNTVYSLVQMHKDNSKLIIVDLVQKSDDGFWMHKPISENVGPYHYDCPERILKQSTSQNPFAVKWREECRQMRRNKAELIKLFQTLPTGIIITTEYGRKLKFLRSYNKSWTQIVCEDIEEGKIYRYSYKVFRPEQLKKEITEPKAA